MYVRKRKINVKSLRTEALKIPPTINNFGTKIFNYRWIHDQHELNLTKLLNKGNLFSKL